METNSVLQQYGDFIQQIIFTLPPGVLIPLFFAFLIAITKGTNAKRIRLLALIGTVIPVLWFILIAIQFRWTGGIGDQYIGVSSWFDQIGLKFSFAADSVSMLLVGLTVLLGPICVLASTTAITERLKTYYCWLLILQGAMTGVFIARDIILFYTFFEFTLVPLYILINLFGSSPANRKAAATKFFLYTFTGSVIALAGLLYVAWQHKTASLHNAWSFDMGVLASTAHKMTFTEQCWVFWALLAGFAIKVPLFPVHTWLPQAHTEAPTAGSVILAGVLLKLGTYGIFKFVLGFCPAACTFYAPTLAVLSIIGIVYAGLICWVQTDVKKLVAYSSVSHLGYCVLGLFALNAVGISGSILYMINHGLSTGALFLLIGMVYERYHTRSLKELGGLARIMPIWASFMVFFTMASVGLPGLNGFVSELFCTLGAFQAGGVSFDHGVKLLPGATWGTLGPWYAVAAGTGVIITAMYLLYMLGIIVWGPLNVPGGHGHGHAHDAAHDSHAKLPTDLCAREIGLLLPLAALCLILGLFPGPILRTLEDPADNVARFIQTHGRDRLQKDDPRLTPANDAENAGAPIRPPIIHGPSSEGRSARPSTLRTTTPPTTPAPKSDASPKPEGSH